MCAGDKASHKQQLVPGAVHAGYRRPTAGHAAGMWSFPCSGVGVINDRCMERRPSGRTTAAT